jgi:hypothetical protein
VAFLVTIGHEVFPHHHHDLENSVFSHPSNYSDHHHSSADFDHLHHGKGNHHHDSEDANPHKFPFHHHLSADGAFDYIRINFNKEVPANFSILADLFSISNAKILPPPEVDLVRFTDKPFLISTIFEPGALGLRAPPSIA